jgi:hypothetical protein
MRRIMTRSAIGCTLVTCFALTTVSASAGAFTRGCAARDLQILMLLEERESENTISQQELSDAIAKMMDARMICHLGRVADALARYDSISDGIAADPLPVNPRAPKRSTSMIPPQP